MARSGGRGSNAIEGSQGWQTVVPKPATAPTVSHKASKLIKNEKANETQIVESFDEVNKTYKNYKNKIQRKGRAPKLSEEEYFNAFIDSGVNEFTARKAAKVLSTNPPILIATSGKQGSGKDSVTAKVLESLGAKENYHLLFSAVLKDEAQEILNDLRSSNNREEAIKKVMLHNVGMPEAEQVIEYAYEGARLEQEVTTRDRTNWVRLMLQYWGMEVRRNQDIDYWLKKGILLAAEAIANEEDIFITDIRFPNEVDRLQTIGFTIARLDVTPETQSKRLSGRDGILTIDPKSLTHSSETALDDYKGFNIRLNNDEGTLEETVSNLVNLFNR